MAHLKCLALENEGVRQIVSAEDVAELEEINIFECEMTRAGEYLLKEVRSSATLSSLIGVVCKDNFLAGVKNVICNIDMGNLLHQYALKNKEVSKIEVAHKERRIHVTYSCKNDLWYEFDLRNRGLPARSLYIPKKNMVISGLKEEIGVKNFGGIYIQSNTELCEYLIKVIGAFQSEDTEENKILLKVFLSYVFDNKVLEVAYKQDVNTSNMFKQLLEQTYRSCMGLLKLTDKYSEAMLEAACKKALSYTASPSYKSIKNILVTGSVKKESEPSDSKTTHKAHGIIRVYTELITVSYIKI